MAQKRRLPVLNNAMPAGGAPAGEGAGAGEEPPPWHWVPLGMVASIATGVVLARSFYLPFQQRSVERVYGVLGSPEAYARVHAALSPAVRDGLQTRLAFAGMAVAALSVAVGGLLVGRFGPRTTARHGALSGLGTLMLLVMLVGRGLRGAEVLAYVLAIPLGGLCGYLGALGGTVLRARAQRGL